MTGRATVLVTGFGPYADTPVNPAQAVAARLNGASVDGARVVGIEVPNSFGESVGAVRAAMERERPELIVMLGEYGGRALITVERMALNLEDSARYGLADNAGVIRTGSPVIEGAPAAYFTTLPVRAIVSDLRSAGIPADVSDTPGTFVCNHLLYSVLHALEEDGSSTRAGWIHLPHLPEVAARPENLGAPSMALDVSVEGVRVAIGSALDHEHDISDVPPSRWQI